MKSLIFFVYASISVFADRSGDRNSTDSSTFHFFTTKAPTEVSTTFLKNQIKKPIDNFVHVLNQTFNPPATKHVNIIRPSPVLDKHGSLQTSSPTLSKHVNFLTSTPTSSKHTIFPTPSPTPLVKSEPSPANVSSINEDYVGTVNPTSAPTITKVTPNPTLSIVTPNPTLSIVTPNPTFSEDFKLLDNDDGNFDLQEFNDDDVNTNENYNVIEYDDDDNNSYTQDDFDDTDYDDYDSNDNIIEMDPYDNFDSEYEDNPYQVENSAYVSPESNGEEDPFSESEQGNTENSDFVFVKQNATLILASSLFFSFCLIICTVIQFKNNPAGVWASLCRCLSKFIFCPCYFICCRGSQKRSGYGHQGMQNNDFGDFPDFPMEMT